MSDDKAKDKDKDKDKEGRAEKNILVEGDNMCGDYVSYWIGDSSQ